MSRVSALLAAALAAGLASTATARDIAPLAQSPTLSASQVVFAYGGYLWSVPRAGGQAKQLTKGGHEGRPVFSPDGKWIAFSGQYEGVPAFAPTAEDAYVIPAAGGEPKRLTWYPGPDIAVGWTPDSKRVLFASTRESYARFHRLYTVPVEGGVPEALPMWRGETASYSPDASQVAYVPNWQWEPFWKGYQGGQTTPIYLAGLKDLQIEKIPRKNSNDSQPVWMGDTVYFLSDRAGPTTLFGYDTRTKAVRQLLANPGLDLKTLSAGPDALVYEQFGDVFIFDPTRGTSKKVEIRVPADLPATQPRDKKVAGDVAMVSLSPAGDRAAVEARGEIFTVPAGAGETRNLTHSAGVAERSPSWSPDGRRVAYFSDESGEYALHIRGDEPSGPVKKIPLEVAPWFDAPGVWSPDGRRIAFQDMKLNLLVADIETGRIERIDTDPFNAAFQPAWSPDSRWIAYQRSLPNLLHAVFLYGLDGSKNTQVTDGMVDARYPAFDKGGEALLFAASTDMGLALSGQDLSATQRPVTRTIYAVALKASPGGDAFRVDLDGLGARVTALPIPPANYVGLAAGKPGVFFLQEAPLISPLRSREVVSVSSFSLAAPKLAPFVAGVAGFSLSADGRRALYRQGRAWTVAATDAPPKAGEGAIDLAKLQVRVEPRVEWRQMYREVWRQERDYFYDPNFHGVDLAAAEKRYAPYLQRVGGRADLDYLFQEMLGNLSIGHLFVLGGDAPRIERTNVGLLGADLGVENDRFRFGRIYDGDVWSAGLRAPLAGAKISAGDYLLAVNGKALRPTADPYSFFVDTGGKPTHVTVAASPDGRDAREITVTPGFDDSELRQRAWEEDNRRKVDALSGGKLAYVHLPDTGPAGYANFNRFYFAQIGKEGAVIDERFNEGGRVADYVVDVLRRPLRHCIKGRTSQVTCTPMAQIYGPKAMLINEMSGSGGDALPWMFRDEKIGPLVGKRTWGGLISPGGAPSLLDGGAVAAPSIAHYGLNGDWVAENHGIAPDIEVENDPASMAAGRDLQLERAVQVTLEALEKSPSKIPDPPPYPVYRRGADR